MTTSSEALADLRNDIARAGYYPALVCDVLEIALAREAIEAHLVHQETVFDNAEVRRHLTALTLTPTRLIMVHIDDVPPLNDGGTAAAAATSEAIALSQIRSVGLTHGVTNPATYPEGEGTSELTMALNWGGVQRVEIEPATCGDPSCQADHGYSGNVMAEDLVVRISAQADGQEALERVVDFAAKLSFATTGAPR